MSNKKIIVALDVENYDHAMQLADSLPPEHCRVKVGKSLFTRCGPAVVKALHNIGHEVFLDLKFHDIPNTVAEAVDAAADLGVWMVNVHAQGGSAMLRAAREALKSHAKPPLLIAVTILTSTSSDDWIQMGCKRSLAEQVDFLTELTVSEELDGVVCSALEAQQLKKHYGEKIVTVTPGIRPLWSSKDDQSRIVTPQQAIADGSDYLVIGRPISRATDPAEALSRILAEINS